MDLFATYIALLDYLNKHVVVDRALPSALQLLRSVALTIFALKQGTSGGLSEIYLSVCVCVCVCVSLCRQSWHFQSRVVQYHRQQGPPIPGNPVMKKPSHELSNRLLFAKAITVSLK